MTGQEHYRLAEVALADSETAVGEYGDRDAAIRLAAVAQAHATLALVAATRDSDAVGPWAEALGVPQPARLV